MFRNHVPEFIRLTYYAIRFRIAIRFHIINTLAVDRWLVVGGWRLVGVGGWVVWLVVGDCWWLVVGAGW